MPTKETDASGRKSGVNGARQRRLHPKLRVIRNGSTIVNTLRAERADALRVRDPACLETPRHRGPGDEPIPLTELGKPKWAAVEPVAPEIVVGAFVELSESESALDAELVDIASAKRDNVVVGDISLDRIDAMCDSPHVRRIEIGERVSFIAPTATRVDPVTGAPDRSVPGRELHRDGAGVIVGIIDVQGFDFAHPDFLDDDGAPRFYRIWDQAANHRPPPRGFEYGAELKRRHMHAAMEASGELGVAPFLLEPQSLIVPSSHATHVASIAAGKSGVCPRAVLIGVSLSLSDDERDRRQSLYDSTRLAHAVDYIFGIGQKLGMPVSLNVSLGTNGHAHDGTSAINRWIDHALATAGRSVTVAAGNAGQEAARHPKDFGFLSGRIHTSGRFRAAGLTRNIEWVVGGFGVADLSENELELWYAAQDRFSLALKPPDSTEWIGPVAPGAFVENQALDDGTMVSIYNDLYVPANGHNRIACYLSPFMSPDGVVGVRPGTWLIRLSASEVRDGRYDAWIERDDPRPVPSPATPPAWGFPSFFTVDSHVDQSSVSSLACGNHVVGVANLDEASERIHITSSQGPTRDGRFKPEIAAPGTDIVAANGFDDRERNLWARMTGTSMASPYVAGVIGLMLAVEPNLTAAQISGILRRSAQPLPGDDFEWRDDSGFGRIDAKACVYEVSTINRLEDSTEPR